GLPTVQRTDPSVSFDLKGAAPAPGVPPIGFSVRWRGNLYIPAAGEVTFKVRMTDGVRLKVNGELAIDEWNDQSETIFSASMRLDGAQFYTIEVEYYNKTGNVLLHINL